MKTASLFAALALAAVSTSAFAGGQVAVAMPGLKGKTKLEVSSPVLKSGQPIPDAYTSYGASTSPPLNWRGAPAGARSFAFLLEDPDAPMASPFVHWVVWNIPASAHAFPAGATAPGAVEGKMGAGRRGFMGPRPPAGAPHHYHFELFALDQTLDLDAGSDAKTLENAMVGHVLASGELVATYQKK